MIRPSVRATISLLPPPYHGRKAAMPLTDSHRTDYRPRKESNVIATPPPQFLAGLLVGPRLRRNRHGGTGPPSQKLLGRSLDRFVRARSGRAFPSRPSSQRLLQATCPTDRGGRPRRNAGGQPDRSGRRMPVRLLCDRIATAEPSPAKITSGCSGSP